MSDYNRQKVIRYPIEKEDLEKLGIDTIYDIDMCASFEGKVKDYEHPTERFHAAPTENDFLDYVIRDTDGDGDWGKVRKLYDSEEEVFGAKFKEVMPWIDVDKLRVVEFCWYNSCEAPDYYHIENDPFYQKIL